MTIFCIMSIRNLFYLFNILVSRTGIRVLLCHFLVIACFLFLVDVCNIVSFLFVIMII